MKAKEKLVTRTVVVYIAEDGTEFSVKSACELYERELLLQKCYAVAKKLPHFSCSPNDADIDCCIDFYFVRNEDELDAVKRYSFSDKDAEGWSFEAPEYPCWIRVLVNGDTGCGYICTFDAEVESAERYVQDLRQQKLEAENVWGLNREGTV